MTLRIQGIPTDDVRRLRDGGPDANGQPPLVRVAEGVANPCRHCLGLIAEGNQKLVLGYRRAADAMDPRKDFGVVLNPPKSRPIELHAGDRVIVLAES